MTDLDLDNELIQEPTAPIENGEFSTMTKIYDGPHLCIFTAGDQVILEVIDDDGFSNGLSLPWDATPQQITSLMSDFVEYTKE